MASRDVPGLGLKAEWDLFETSWKTGMDENLWRLSLLVQTRIKDFVIEEPTSPVNGDIYIILGGAYDKHLLVYDMDMWVPVEPFDGQLIYNAEDKEVYKYDLVDGWVPLVSPERIKEIYESNDDTNAFTDALKDKLAGIENNATADMSNAEIKAAYEANTDTNAFTDAEKAKLASLAASRFLGIYATLTALQAAHPAPPAGSFAYVDQGASTDIMSYIWDANDLKYVPQASGNTQETPESIKVKYEANDDTNAFTDAEKAKLADLEPGGSGLPDGGTTGQYLVKTGNGDGEAGWADIDIPEPEDELPDMVGMSGRFLSVSNGVEPVPVWVELPDIEPGVPDGGTTGQVLTKQSNDDGDAIWADPTGGGWDGIPEAPEDGKTYGRKDAEWVEVISGGSSGESLYEIVNTASDIIVTVDNVKTYFRGDSAFVLDIRLPLNSAEPIEIGTIVSAIQVGTGFVRFTSHSLVTVNCKDQPVTARQYAVIHAIKVAENEWDVYGDTGDYVEESETMRYIGTLDELTETSYRAVDGVHRTVGE